MERSRTWQCSASEASVANSTALALSTGSAPGRPRQTGQMLVFGAEPKLVGATAEGLGGGEQLHVDFESDDGLVLGQDFRRQTSSGGHI